MAMDCVMKAIVAGNIFEAYALYYFAMEHRVTFESCVSHVNVIAAHITQHAQREKEKAHDYLTEEKKMEKVKEHMINFVGHLIYHRKIDAVKAYLTATGCGLVEAKNTIEAIPSFKRAHGVITMPKY